jgi:DNA-directed RNA polymerase specialized sigma24 family protein
MHVEPETIIMDARALLREGHSVKAWRKLEALWLNTASRWIGAYLWRQYGISASKQQDAVDDLRVDCLIAWVSGDVKHEFWQVKFFCCLRRLTHDRMDKLCRQAKEETDGDSLRFIHLCSGESFSTLHLTEPLPIRCRFAVERIAEGYSYTEVAEMLGCSVRTVWNYRKEAARILRLADKL